MTKKEPLYILDCYAVIYRMYFAFMKRPLTSADGTNVSAVFGFFKSFFQLFDEFKPEHFVCAFDPKTKTFRHELYDQYKANRQKTPEDLHAQVPLVEKILSEMKIPSIRVDGFEADDVIATLSGICAREGRECVIISGDKDLLQLVTGKTRMLKPNNESAFKLTEEKDVPVEWGVTPKQILDYLSLTGDASDNIPGVKGIGDKSALKLLADYPTIDDIYANIDSISPESLKKKLVEGKESAFFSRELVKLRMDVPLPSENIDDYALDPSAFSNASESFKSLSMNSLANKTLSKAYGGLKTQISENKEDSLTNDGNAEVKVQKTAKKGQASLFEEMDEEESIEPNSFNAPMSELSVAMSANAELTQALQGNGNYRAIIEESELVTYLREAEATKLMAFDCETDGLNESSCAMLGFSLSIKEKEAVYVPLVSPDSKVIPKEKALAALKKTLENKDVKIIAQNLKFDYKVLHAHGIIIANPYHDTMIAAWLLDASRSGYDLASLAERYLGLRGISFKDIVPKGETFASVPLEKATVYASEDADFTYRLALLFEDALEKRGLTELFRTLEMPVLPILAAMEERGIQIDAEALGIYSKELEISLATIEKEIYELVGHSFNINSPKQLQEVLFIERKLKTGKKTKTGYSTDISVLEELAQDDPVPAKILEQRSFAKLKNTYVDTLPLLRDTQNRVHTHFMQAGTATGRLSSTDPNLQNIPVKDEAGRRIRKAFTAKEGYTLVSADYSQIELVVLANLSHDKNLSKAFIEGTDVHKRTASLLFNVKEDEVNPDQRRMAKTINFGVIYGMSAFRLSNELKIPRKTAADFIDAYFATYSGVSRFAKEVVESSEKSGRVHTIAGRERIVEGITSSNKTVKSQAERIALNTPIQGSAADIVKYAMLKVNKALEETINDAHILLQVHDELIVECKTEDIERVEKLLKETMENAYPLEVPLKVSVEHAQSWGDMH